jgi:membrane protein YdbS with pleckstrin-like domain
MENIFDYIYYRMTKAYFKWDGRTGITAIIGISMIQTLLLGDIVTLAIRLNIARSDTAPYSKMIAYAFAAILVILIITNYKKYNGQYNRLRLRWKSETKSEKIVRGILVCLSLIVPWIPIVLIGIFM